MRKRMPETDYLTSRMCRVMGNHTAYQIIKLLFRKEHTAGELSQAPGIDLATISRICMLLKKFVELLRTES